jgi:hypothetical protein
MTDLVERLRAALDATGREADEHVHRKSAVWVRRLVERDRALLMEYKALKSLIEEENWERGVAMIALRPPPSSPRDGWLRAGRLLALQHGVERAAEFWLRDT